jgi:DNA-binding NtrC family response regulator
VIDDDPNDALVRLLALYGIHVEWAITGQAGLEMARMQRYDAIVVDLCLPDLYGLSVIERIIARGYEGPVMALTGLYTEPESEVLARQRGAADFRFKPMSSEDLVQALQRVMQAWQARQGENPSTEPDGRTSQENLPLQPVGRTSRQNLPAEPRPAESRFGIVATSPVMRAVLEWIDRVGPTNMPVLLTGETGTGKELMARALHAKSARASGPFVAVNCGAIPEGLWESEFFGHRRGAFTNAIRDTKGLIEQAASGTLFLDEVGELPIPAQVKLLRFLDDGEVRRVGDDRTRHVDVRVIAATNRSLPEDVRQRRFREDLYYRLAAAVRHLPALRERSEDVEALAAYWLPAIGKSVGRLNVHLTAAALRVLRRHSWPGNVRELRHVLESALCLAVTDQVTEQNVLAVLTSKSSSVSTRPLQLDESDEANRTLTVLEQNRWNRTQAARRLAIDRKTLWRRLRRLGY